MVMEWLEGETLEARLDREGVEVMTAVEIAVQTCAALAEAHAHDVIHRDLKPANLFLTRDRTGALRVKVLDFGIAKLSEGQVALTATGVVIGTPNYMAPEQAIGDALDARADIYALGVILYEMLAGTVPFRGDSALSVLHQHSMRTAVAPSLAAPARAIAAELEKIVMRCLEKRPGERFASAADLADALTRFRTEPAAGKPLDPVVSPTSNDSRALEAVDEIEPAGRRSHARWVVLTVLLAAAAGITVVFAFRGGSSRQIASTDVRPADDATPTALEGRSPSQRDVSDADATAAELRDAISSPVEAIAADAAPPMKPVTCTAQFFDCTATLTPTARVGDSFEIALVLVGRDPAHARIIAAGRLTGRIEMKDKRTHATVHEATARFDAEGHWTMSLRLERALTYHVHVDLLDLGREIDSVKLPDLTVAAP